MVSSRPGRVYGTIEFGSDKCKELYRVVGLFLAVFCWYMNTCLVSSKADLFALHAYRTDDFLFDQFLAMSDWFLAVLYYFFIALVVCTTLELAWKSFTGS